MADIEKGLAGLQAGADVLFLLVGAVLVFAMHGGFAFLEAGTVRHKNQVNALCKILVDFAISTVAYFFIGYTIAYGVSFYASAAVLNGAGAGFAPQGITLVKFFFLCTFAAAVPAIVSGGIAERARFVPQCAATALIVGLFYPFFEGIVWNKSYGLQEHVFKGLLGAEFHDFAGSVVVHAIGGWIGFSAVRQLGPRFGRYDKGQAIGIPPSSIPWLAMGSWLLCIGWFGFNVMSAQSLQSVTGLVAMNSLMAMCGGILAALIAGEGDPGFIHNGALAGLVAICAGSDVVHPIGALLIGGVAGTIFVYVFQMASQPQVELRRRARRVAPAWPVRRVGRHRLRHLRPEDLRRARRRRLPCAARRQPDGCRLWRDCRLHRLRHRRCAAGSEALAGGGAPRRRPQRAQHQCQPRRGRPHGPAVNL